MIADVEKVEEGAFGMVGIELDSYHILRVFIVMYRCV